jgi:hypothetical protein
MSATKPARRRLRVVLPATALVVGGLLTALMGQAALAQGSSAPTSSASASPAPTSSATPPTAAPVPAAPFAWQRAEVPFTKADVELWDVIAGGLGFIAVGGGFAPGEEVGSAAIWVSEDGLSWQSVPLPGDAAAGVPRSITATADGYVAVGSGCCPDEAAVWLSVDGLSWERLPDQPGFADTAMLGVASAPEGIVAVGCSAALECFSGLAWTSIDGRTWSEPLAIDLLPAGVAATSAGVVALGSTESYDGSAALALSPDGLAWPEPTVVAAGGWLHAAVEQPSGVLAVGGTTNPRNGRSVGLAATSADGLAWEPQDARHLRKVWVEDAAVHPDGWLFVGWQANGYEQSPAALWTTDLQVFEPLEFPREMKGSGMLHAVAVGEDGVTAVAVGSTVLNRGVVPTVWVSVEVAAPG